MSERPKVYVAGGFEDKENVRDWMQRLTEEGFEITADWTLHRPLAPFIENIDLCKDFAKEDLEGVANCDIFIFKSEMAGSGAHSELGAAIVLGKRVFVVGEKKNDKLFYFHPQVTRVDTLDEVLDKIVVS